MPNVEMPELYSRVHSSLKEMMAGSREISWEQAMKVFENTPGLHFGFDSSWDEVLNCMIKWGWLSGKEGETIKCCQ